MGGGSGVGAMRKGDERAQPILREFRAGVGDSGSYPKSSSSLLASLRRSIPAALVERGSGRRREVALVGLGLVGADLRVHGDDLVLRGPCDLEIVTTAGETVSLPCEVDGAGEGRILVEFGRMHPSASVWLTRVLASN